MTVSPRVTAPAPGTVPSSGRRTVVSLTLASLAYALMQMMVVPALPAIQDDLGTDATTVAWVVSAFLLSTAVATPVLGRLGDMFGRERVLLAVLGVLIVGSVVGALAPTLELVIVARVLQGCGGAVFPLAYGIVRSALPAERVPVAIGVISGSFGIGGSAGLVLAGPLVDHVSWHAIFWVGILLPVVAIVAVRAFVPRTPRRRPEELDWVGGLLLAGGLGAALLAIANVRSWGWTAPATWGLLAGGVATLAAWARWELGRRAPLVDVRLLMRRTVWPANAIAVVVGFGMYATGYLVPQLAQGDVAAGGAGFGMGVTGTSLLMLPAMLTGLAVGAWSGMLTRRFGPALPLVAGAATMAGGYVVLAVAHGTIAPVIAGVLLSHGIGLNLSLAAMASAVVAAVPAAQAGEASGMNTMLRTVGGAIGGQVMAALVVVGGAHGRPTSTGFAIAFSCCAVVLGGAAALAVALRRTSAR